MRQPTPRLAATLGHEIVDKRIEILRRIGEAGSISEAARAAGVSYKAAWQAIETLSNLAGTMLVAKAVGGAGGGGAVLTEAGRQVLEAARRLATARAEVLSGFASPPQQPGRPDVAALGLRTSMRNMFRGRIVTLTVHENAIRISLALDADTVLYARVTAESAQLLGLQPDLQVLVLCKATAVGIGQAIDTEDDRNLLAGTVSRMPTDDLAGEAGLQLACGLQLTGFVAGGHGLKIGMPAAAGIDEAAVVVALTG